jgi:hypothetical protein
VRNIRETVASTDEKKKIRGEWESLVKNIDRTCRRTVHPSNSRSGCGSRGWAWGGFESSGFCGGFCGGGVGGFGNAGANAVSQPFLPRSVDIIVISNYGTHVIVDRVGIRSGGRSIVRKDRTGASTGTIANVARVIGCTSGCSVHDFLEVVAAVEGRRDDGQKREGAIMEEWHSGSSRVCVRGYGVQIDTRGLTSNELG